MIFEKKVSTGPTSFRDTPIMHVTKLFQENTRHNFFTETLYYEYAQYKCRRGRGCAVLIGAYGK